MRKPTTPRWIVVVSTLFVLLTTMTTTTFAKEDKVTPSSSKEEEEDRCGLYMAISSTSTSDKTLWGLYVGKDIPAGQAITTPDLAVPILDLRANNVLYGDTVDETLQEQLYQTVEYLEESFWVPDSMGGKFEMVRQEDENEEDPIPPVLIAALNGCGFLGAYNTKFTNADWNHQTAYRGKLPPESSSTSTTTTTTTTSKQVSHPNRGAISSFYNVELQNIFHHDYISAGQELFVNYGSSYEEDEGDAKLTNNDYAKMDQTVEQMLAFFDKHQDTLATKESGKQEIYNFLIQDVLQAALGREKAQKLASALPSKPDLLDKVKDAGGVLAYSHPDVIRKLDWLEQHGVCVDNLQVGPSTIPHAGRGAFATRKLSKGSVITTTPLLQIPMRSVLDMHEGLVLNEQQWEMARPVDAPVTGQQLLLNYCWGHPSSTLLLYPTAPTVGFINHANTPKQVNAKLVWSNHPANQAKSWFDVDPMELVDEDHAYLGLLMDIVATQEIQPGDEILLDYGKEWEAAWNEHTKDWSDRKKKGEIPEEWPLRAEDLNAEYKTKPFRTEKELEADPYPENVGLVAFIMLDETDEEGTAEDPKQWVDPDAGESAFHSDNLFEPDIVSRELIDRDADEKNMTSYTYTIRWTNGEGEETFVKGLPHAAFAFVDEPETSDFFTVEKPFRHYIGIPDDVFPKGPWRNAD